MGETKSALQKQLARLQSVQAWCSQSEAPPRINAMVDSRRSEEGIPILPEEIDGDPGLLNCANGTLDLKTGQLREHRRGDMLTKLSPVAYNPDADCEVWERFIDQIFQSNSELILFVRRLLGYCWTGDVREQILPIFWGTGANGKSTLLNAILEMMGDDYAIAGERTCSWPARRTASDRIGGLVRQTPCLLRGDRSRPAPGGKPGQGPNRRRPHSG